MRDFKTVFDYTNGADFPNTRSKDSSGGSSTDGTHFNALFIDDLWGFFQEALSAAGDSPDGNPELAGSSQVYDALKVMARVQPASAFTFYFRFCTNISDTGCNVIGDVFRIQLHEYVDGYKSIVVSESGSAAFGQNVVDVPEDDAEAGEKMYLVFTDNSGTPIHGGSIPNLDKLIYFGSMNGELYVNTLPGTIDYNRVLFDRLESSPSLAPTYLEFFDIRVVDNSGGAPVLSDLTVNATSVNAVRKINIPKFDF